MKRAIYCIAIAVLATCLFNSCKKKDDDLASETIAKLIGKWTFVSLAVNEYHSNQDHVDVVSGEAGDHMEFLNGGKVVVRLLASSDTARYSVIGNRHVVIDQADKFDLKTLSPTDLVLYRKTVYSAASFIEETYTLKK